MKDVIRYTTMPSVGEFQRDSSITFAIRSDDRIIIHLDHLLSRYHSHVKKRDNDKRCVILCDLFVTANYWIKSFHERHPRMKRGRYPAVLGLFERAKYELSFIFACREPEVGRRITEIFGRDLTPNGQDTDSRGPGAAYYDKQQLQLYRFRFRSGRAYQLCLGSGDRGRFAPVNSKDFYEDISVRDPVTGIWAKPDPDWGPFVMTLEREFYMSKHKLTTLVSKGIFHSAYTRGGTVSAAGWMHIRNGEILGIKGNSGHYKPLENNLAMMITALGMFSVPLKNIQVYSWSGELKGSALDFVRSRLTWEKFVEARDDYRKRKAVAAPQAPQPMQGIHGNQQEDDHTYRQTPAAPTDYSHSPM